MSNLCVLHYEHGSSTLTLFCHTGLSDICVLTCFMLTVQAIREQTANKEHNV